MTADNSTSPSNQAAAMKRKQFWGRLIVLGLIIAFALLRPKVEAWLEGNNDQGVAANQTDPGQNSGITQGGELGTLTLDDVEEYRKSSAANDNGDTGFLDTVDPGSRTTVTAEPPTESKSTRTTSTRTSSPSNTKSDSKSNPKSSSAKPLPKLAAPPMPANKPSTTTADSRSNPDTKKTTTKAAAAPKKTEPKLGALTLVDRRREIFKSTAGLLYKQGSADRHRLKHVLKHAKDDLSKPVHGVYASDDRDVVLEWIDTAYIKGQKGGKGVRVEEEGDRVVYTVDMGKKIGFVGGQVGERKGHPACKYLRLVVQDGDEVITAFPAQSL